MSDFEVPAELLDEFVHPDIHSLFQHYSELYFDGELGHCSVEWSSGRMTRCRLLSVEVCSTSTAAWWEMNPSQAGIASNQRFSSRGSRYVSGCCEVHSTGGRF